MIFLWCVSNLLKLYLFAVRYCPNVCAYISAARISCVSVAAPQRSAIRFDCVCSTSNNRRASGHRLFFRVAANRICARARFAATTAPRRLCPGAPTQDCIYNLKYPVNPGGPAHKLSVCVCVRMCAFVCKIRWRTKGIMRPIETAAQINIRIFAACPSVPISTPPPAPEIRLKGLRTRGFLLHARLASFGAVWSGGVLTFRWRWRATCHSEMNNVLWPTSFFGCVCVCLCVNRNTIRMKTFAGSRDSARLIG